MSTIWIPCNNPRCDDGRVHDHVVHDDGSTSDHFYNCPYCAGQGGWTSVDDECGE